MERLEESDQIWYRLSNGNFVPKNSLRELPRFSQVIQQEKKLGEKPNFGEIQKTCHESLIKKINEEVARTEKEMMERKMNIGYYQTSVVDTIDPGTKTWYGKRKWDGTLTETVYLSFYELKEVC